MKPAQESWPIPGRATTAELRSAPDRGSRRSPSAGDRGVRLQLEARWQHVGNFAPMGVNMKIDIDKLTEAELVDLNNRELSA